MSDLATAVRIAAAAHAGQVDKAGEPYILHVLRVVKAVEGDEDAMIVAALHDVVEDCTEWTLQRLAAHGFAPQIASAVDAITRRDGEVYAAFISRVAQNPIAARVKLADLQDNMRPNPIDPRQASR